MARTTTVAIAFSVLLAQRVLALGDANGLSRHLAGTDDEAAEWDYRRTSTREEEPYGPSDWYLGYPDCGLDSQSPINIAASLETVEVVKASEFDLEFFSNECASEDLTFQADERVWEVKFDGCEDTPYLKFDGDKYNLLQIHIHSPSEHIIGAAEHDAEFHFVHLREGTDDDLLVVGVLFDTSDYGINTEVGLLWDVLEIGEETTDLEFVVKVYNVIPANPVYAHYSGSLTTPPCTEGVKWIVMTEPSSMSTNQLEQFRSSVALFDDSKVSELSNTNRPVQDLNDRDLYLVRM